MKKVFTFLVVVVFMLCASFAFAGDLHKVQLQSIEPFSIGTEFPQKVEGPFEFQLYADGEFGALEYKVVAARSVFDKSYQLILLVISLDGGKTVHIVGAVSGKSTSTENVGVQCYIDEQFFSGKGFSGVLVPAKDLPGPDALEKVAPKKKLSL